MYPIAPGLHVFAFKDGRVEGIADLSTLRQISISWIGCGPDDLPIAVREVGTEEIYALDLKAQ